MLVPTCREHLHTSGDVPLPLSEAVAFAKLLFPFVDTETHFANYSDKETYFLKDLDSETRDEILTEISANPKNSVAESVFQVQQRSLPDCIEGKQNKLDRAERFRSTLKAI